MSNKKYISLPYRTFYWILIATIVPSIFSDPVDSLQHLFNGEQNSPLMTSTSIVADLNMDTIETIIKERPDSLTAKMNACYRQWKRAIRACYILLDTATADGYNAAPEEVTTRLSMYVQAFPGIAIDTMLVKKEIIIEKYLLQETGITPTPMQIQTGYFDFIGQSPLKSPPSQSAISPILSSRVLFLLDTVVQLCNELSRQQNQRTNEQFAASMEPWPVNEIAVNADSQLCLVINPDNRECIVTVNEFNNFLSLHRIQRRIRLETARRLALRELLTDLHLADRAEKAGIPARKELMEAEEQWVEKRLLWREHAYLTETIDDDRLLNSTYDKYYDRFFREKKLMTVGIIGSTDSLFIDSLYRDIQKKEADTVPSRKRSYTNSLPWVILPSADLPDTIISAIDTLKQKQSCVLKTPFGFFICRIFNVRRQREISFKQARDKLVYLILTERTISQGKPDSILALEYYLKNNNKFITPDTLIVRAWLVPLIDTLTLREMDKKKLQQMISRDTTCFRPRVIGSESLPYIVADELLSRLVGKKDKQTLIGPLTSHFGTWYFSIQKVIAGRKKIPFASAREMIYNELEIQSFPFDSILKTEAGIRAKEQLVLAGAYRKYANNNLEKEIADIPDKDIQKLIENKMIKISYANKGTPDKRLLNIARQMISEKKIQQDQAKINEWIESLVIDRELLFTGCSDKMKN